MACAIKPPAEACEPCDLDYYNGSSSGNGTVLSELCQACWVSQVIIRQESVG